MSWRLEIEEAEVSRRAKRRSSWAEELPDSSPPPCWRATNERIYRRAAESPEAYLRFLRVMHLKAGPETLLKSFLPQLVHTEWIFAEQSF